MELTTVPGEWLVVGMLAVVASFLLGYILGRESGYGFPAGLSKSDEGMEGEIVRADIFLLGGIQYLIVLDAPSLPPSSQPKYLAAHTITGEAKGYLPKGTRVVVKGGRVVPAPMRSSAELTTPAMCW